VAIDDCDSLHVPRCTLVLSHVEEYKLSIIMTGIHIADIKRPDCAKMKKAATVLLQQ